MASNAGVRADAIMSDTSAPRPSTASAIARRISPPRLRAASACVACNMKKIRCAFSKGGNDKECINCIRNNWECRPRERKRKRRKTDTVDKNGSTQTARNVYDQIQPSLSQQSTWDSGFIGWSPRRTAVSEHPHPSLSSEPSPAGLTVAHNQPPVSTHGDMAYSAFRRDSAPSAPTPQHRPEQHPDETSPGTSSFLGRSEYIGGDVPINEEQAKSYPAVATESLSQEDIEMLKLQRVFELPPRAVREGLIDAFMKRCAPWMPIVERSWLVERQGKPPSILLLQAIFLAGSRVSSAPAIAAYASPHEFYRRAKALFWSGYEKNTITVITAVCIMHWYNAEGPEHVSINTSGFWNRIGVGLAYQIGLHKEPSHGRDAPLRRRLWWTLYARDCLISAGHGRPRATNPDDCDVRPLACEDFYGSSSDGALFIAHVQLASLLGELTQCCCRKYLSRQKRQYIENALFRWSRELPENFQLFRKVRPNDPSSSSTSSSPSKLVIAPYNFEARQLHVIYFMIIAILFRSSPPTRAPSTAAILASSVVAGIFEDFLARDEIRFLGPVFTFYLLAAGVSLLSCFRYPPLWERAEQDLQIIYTSQKELSKRWPSAFGSLNVLHSMADEASKIPHHQGGNIMPSLSGLTPDQQACFNRLGTGTDLCRLSEVILGPRSQDCFDVTRRTDDEAYSRTASDMMTAVILAELKTPISTPAALDGYLPLAPVVGNDVHGNVNGNDEPSAEVTEDQILYHQYEGIGNWLLRDWDWNSDIAY